MPPRGIEPRTLRSSVLRSPSWATKAINILLSQTIYKVICSLILRFYCRESIDLRRNLILFLSRNSNLFKIIEILFFMIFLQSLHLQSLKCAHLLWTLHCLSTITKPQPHSHPSSTKLLAKTVSVEDLCSNTFPNCNRSQTRILSSSSPCSGKCLLFHQVSERTWKGEGIFHYLNDFSSLTCFDRWEP